MTKKNMKDYVVWLTEQYRRDNPKRWRDLLIKRWNFVGKKLIPWYNKENG